MTSGEAAGRVFLGNFDFEHALAARSRPSLPARVRRLNAALVAGWVAISDERDAVWTPEPFDGEFEPYLRALGWCVPRFASNADAVARGAELVPWGWTDECRRLALRRGWTYSAPRQEVIREVNARSFSADCEREWGIGLESAAEIHRLDQIPGALHRLPAPGQGWAIKAEYGMSARERILGRGTHLTDAQSRWVAQRLEADGVVHLEPWVRRVEEAGLQLTVHPDGSYRFEGLTTLWCGPGGEYRGSQFSAEHVVDDIWQPAVDAASRAVRRIADHGYFGPVGIDAMRYRDAGGSLRVRPLQDINARWTMGRLAQGFHRLLPEAGTGAWLHVPVASLPGGDAESYLTMLRERLPARVTAERTSPRTVGGHPNEQLAILLRAHAGFDVRPVIEEVFRVRSPG